MKVKFVSEEQTNQGKAKVSKLTIPPHLDQMCFHLQMTG
jgi:hypothetical protein